MRAGHRICRLRGTISPITVSSGASLGTFHSRRIAARASAETRAGSKSSRAETPTPAGQEEPIGGDCRTARRVEILSIDHQHGIGKQTPPRMFPRPDKACSSPARRAGGSENRAPCIPSAIQLPQASPPAVPQSPRSGCDNARPCTARAGSAASASRAPRHSPDALETAASADHAPDHNAPLIPPESASPDTPPPPAIPAPAPASRCGSITRMM